jgi:hypothetical protein
MKTYGLSNTFWVVTKPSPVSELGDICFACTFKQLMNQSRGRLHEQDIIGIFADEAEAKQMAMKLLGRNIVRTSDSVIVEVLVNILMTPIKRNMTARVLSRAAIEAVGNAVRKAEEQGFSHRLEGLITMGMGKITVQDHLTLIG